MLWMQKIFEKAFFCINSKETKTPLSRGGEGENF